jgi:hypothetical protein
MEQLGLKVLMVRMEQLGLKVLMVRMEQLGLKEQQDRKVLRVQQELFQLNKRLNY